MLKSERRELIIDTLRKERSVKITELMERFGVSNETIRRDLVYLEEQGMARCVYGGAVYDFLTTNEYNYSIRIKNNQQEKLCICREAAALVNDGDSIAIGGSTTTLELGRHLARKNRLTVVTNSLYIANEIASNTLNKVILTGGVLSRDEQKMTGPDTVASFGRYFVDKAFFSAAGISEEGGLTEYSEEERGITETLIRQAKKAILLNDTSKFNVTAFYKICDTREIDEIITDWRASARDVQAYENMGITLRRANK